jgi:predicted RecA/RadA family phage recombinase
MAETLRSDGNAVEVTLLSTVAKGTPVILEGFFGITMQAGSSGDTVALEIAQREHEIEVPEGVTGAKGDILYLDSDGVITNTDTDTPFLKVTLAKDANNYVWGILLPQKTE